MSARRSAGPGPAPRGTTTPTEDAGADVRLLGPALVAWAAAAALVTARPTVVLTALAASLLVAGAAGLVAVHGTARGRPRGPHQTRRAWTASVCAAGLLAALALAAVLAHRGVASAGPVAALADERAVVRAEGVVVADPRTIGDGAERRDGVLLRVRLTQVTARGATATVRTPVVVFAEPSWARVRWHERVRLAGRLGPPRPGDDVVATLAVRGPPVVLAGAGPVERAAEHVRSRLRAAADPLPADARGLVPALVIGDTSRTPADLAAAMKATSLTHLSAVSGSNVSVVLVALVWLCGVTGVPRRARPAVALTGLAGFVVLARPEPSVVRAAVMGTVGLLAVTAGRRRAGMPALGAAIVVLLLVDPWLARSFGFALSALATLGILLFARPWGDAVGAHLPARLAGLGPALAIPVAAQVMCAPVTLLLQPGVSLVGVPANVLAEPLVAPATAAGVAAAVLATCWVPLGTACAWAAALPTLGIAQVARRGAALPGGSLPWPQGAAGAWLLVALTVVVLLAGRRIAWWARLRPWLVVGVVLVAGSVLVPVRGVAWPLASWSFVACDVGQGDGLVLASGPGAAVVVDTGPDGDRIVACLRRLHVDRVDAVVLTHFDADHATGLGVVLDAYRVGAVHGPQVDLPRRNADTVYRVAAQHGLRVDRLQAGDRLDVGAVHAEVLWPRRLLAAGSPQNNASTVLLADVAGTRLLLCADIEREAAHEITLDLRRRAAHDIDVLKVAHHGSSNADPRLAPTAGAPLAVISVGRDNDYGHPAAATLTALARAGVTVVRTDRCGDAAVTGHGPSLRYACRGP